METLQTIVSILSSCEETPSAFPQIEPHMYAMLDKLTSPEARSGWLHPEKSEVFRVVAKSGR